MINDTIKKFGHPATLVAEYAHWVVLLRPAAPTLGALVLAAKSDATAFADLAPDAFAELAVVTSRIEAALDAFCGYEKINYLMLMMVDPHVHFHVLPRYSDTRNFDAVDYPDAGWPGMPALAEARTLDGDAIARMTQALRQCGLT